METSSCALNLSCAARSVFTTECAHWIEIVKVVRVRRLHVCTGVYRVGRYPMVSPRGRCRLLLLMMMSTCGRVEAPMPGAQHRRRLLLLFIGSPSSSPCSRLRDDPLASLVGVGKRRHVRRRRRRLLLLLRRHWRHYYSPTQECSSSGCCCTCSFIAYSDVLLLILLDLLI